MSSGAAGPTKPCAVCALPIPRAAKVCAHCDSAQSSWLRRLKVIGIVGGAVVAILPLADAARSLREIALGKHRAEVKLRAVSCDPSEITLAVMNFGNGPAFIGAPTFRTSGPTSGYAPNLALKAEEDMLIIEASSVKKLLLKGWIGEASADLPRSPQPDQCTYHIAFKIYDAAEHNDQSREIECACPSE